MPKLRRLNGLEVVRILRGRGFEVVRIKGSHHIMRRTVNVTTTDGATIDEVQTINVPVHGSQPLATGMLKRLYRDMQRYLTDEELRPHFYTE